VHYVSACEIRSSISVYKKVDRGLELKNATAI
jgi:hypothetical protein